MHDLQRRYGLGWFTLCAGQSTDSQYRCYNIQERWCFAKIAKSVSEKRACFHGLNSQTTPNGSCAQVAHACQESNQTRGLKTGITRQSGAYLLHSQMWRQAVRILCVWVWPQPASHCHKVRMVSTVNPVERRNPRSVLGLFRADYEIIYEIINSSENINPVSPLTSPAKVTYDYLAKLNL